MSKKTELASVILAYPGQNTVTTTYLCSYAIITKL